MYTAYVVVVVTAVVSNTAAALVDFLRNRWILANMTSYGVPHSWIMPLGWAKAAGALGLLAGIAVPALGVAAAAGLVLFFTGAVLTVVRGRRYPHIVFPGGFLALAVACLALRLAV